MWQYNCLYICVPEVEQKFQRFPQCLREEKNLLGVKPLIITITL